MLGEWFVRVDGQQYGPYTSDQLKSYAATGHVTPTSEVRRGNGPWCAASKVKGMFPADGPAATAPPPIANSAPANSPQSPPPPGPMPVTPSSATLPSAHASGATTETELYVASPAMFRNHPFGFAACLLLSLVGVGLVILIAWYIHSKGTRLTVTNRRTTLRTGIFSKEINEVFHRDVRNIRLSQSFSQRILGVGTIELSSSGQSDVEIAVSGIPDPEQVKSIVDKYRT